MFLNRFIYQILLLITSVLVSYTVSAQKVISLEEAIYLAKQNDPWLQSNRLEQQAIEDRSIAAGTLPDPKLSLGVVNLPSDTWQFDQEGMTQFKVGVSQMFPRGDSLEIKQQQLKIAANKYPLLREDRKAKVTKLISEIWLDAFLAQHTINLIKKDWDLFEQIADVAEANYSNTVGKTRQQDVIRAQLEITQLEDRLTVEQLKLDTSIARLNEWLHIFENDYLDSSYDFDKLEQSFFVSDQLPVISLIHEKLLQQDKLSRNELAHRLVSHPAIMAVEVKKQVSKKAVELARQKYSTQWGVNASYSYRDDMPTGDDRADLFSIGITFDLPLFTDNRQDKEVSASIAQAEAIRTEKFLMTRQMISAIEKEIKEINRLNQRQQIYQELLLKQSNNQAIASLSAYTNDDGDFAEVVRARIAELNAKIVALKITVDKTKSIARLNYLLIQHQSPDLTKLQINQAQSIGE
ncbi:MAG: TolC family protein [Enterobacterales bacterium]|nr:TolC family protein [Enterobacterales bacterium]